MLDWVRRNTWTFADGMKSAACLAIIFAFCLACGPGNSQEDDRIYYGSRAGMHLTTVSKKGIGTSNAVIFVEHTPKDAKAYCVGYEGDNSMACVRRTMAEIKVGDRVTANCTKRSWTDMFGQSFKFLRRAKQTDGIMADYLIRDLKTGEILDGSSASGYGTQITIFTQLCPGVAKWRP